VSADLEPILDRGAADDRGEPHDLRTMVSRLREQVFADVGVPLPAPRLAVNGELPERCAVVSIHEVPAKVVRLDPGLGDYAACRRVRDETLAVLQQRAADFITLAVAQRLLDELEQFASAEVRNVVPKPVPLPLLRDVLRRLVAERVSIRDLQGVLEALSTAAPADKDAQRLTEFVRSQLNRSISFRLAQGADAIRVVLVDELVEDTIRRAVVRNEAGAFLTLAPRAARDIHDAVARATAGLPPDQPRVFLTSPDVRAFLWQLVRVDMPDASVVSYADILPSIQLTPVGRVSPG